MINRSRIQCFGFTLIEIMIVIGLVSLLMGYLSTRIGLVGDVEIKTSVTKLARTIRVAYNYAIIDRVTHRIAIDLTRGTYWVEAANKKSLLQVGQTEREKTRKEIAEELKEEEEKFKILEQDIQKSETDIDAEGADKRIVYNSPLLEAKKKSRQAAFSKVKISEIKGMKLADEIKFADVQAQHNANKIIGPKEEIEGDDIERMAYIYFLPSGFVERAVIHIVEKGKEEDGRSFTLVTSPLTGGAVLSLGYNDISIEEEKSEE